MSILQQPINQSLPELLKQLSPSQLFVLVDENTQQYCYPLVKESLPTHTLIEVPAGEQYKTLDTCQHIWQQLTNADADRRALLLNLGGGVITDMGGFCAATYKRGIRFVNIPTTLLAQVDASVGSKTGVDFGSLKNHIGLFAEAEAVLVDTAFLKTLPARELRSGYAEVIKHALIADADYWSDIRVGDWQQHNWPQIVARSIEIKQKVVEQDPTEKGLRKILNFGHTLGHALESACLTTEHHLLHGEAIAIGMQAEAYLATTVGLLRAEDLDKIEQYLESVYPVVAMPEKVVLAAQTLLIQDKKNEGGQLLFSLPDRIGNCRYNVPVRPQQAAEALQWYQQKKPV